MFAGKDFFDRGEDLGCTAQQMFADRDDPRVVRGMVEDGEPELPVEGRLVPSKTRSLRGWVITAKSP